MAVTINASNTAGFILNSDTSGVLELQSAGTTKANVSSTGLTIGQYNPSSSLLTSATAQNSTSGTFIDFTSIPSWVKRITVCFSAVSGSGTSPFIVQLGTASSFETSGYSGITMYSTVGAAISTGFNVTTTAAGAQTLSGTMVLSQINASTNTYVCNSLISATASDVNYTCAGTKSLSGALTRIRITAVNGTDTFDAGSINILYE